jgi:hypothetical protein
MGAGEARPSNQDHILAHLLGALYLNHLYIFFLYLHYELLICKYSASQFLFLSLKKLEFDLLLT